MVDLLTKFKPSVQANDFSHGVEFEGRNYVAGLEDASLDYGCFNGYALFGHIYVDKTCTNSTRIWTPKLLNPFHRSGINIERKTREFKHWTSIYSEPSERFLERFLSGLLEKERLTFTQRDDAKRFILPIWEHYQPLIDAANIEFEEIKKSLITAQ